MSRITFVAMLSIILSFIVTPQTLFMAAASAQSTTTTSTENATNSAATQQSTAILEPGGIDVDALRNSIISTLRQPATALDLKMAQLSSSNKTEDIATFAYILAYPLITSERSFNWFTNPKSPPAPNHGPANEMNCNPELTNANDTGIVSPNADTLYCLAWMDLSKGPLVLKVPPISPDRYYTFQFLDAYTNVFTYVGTRATGSTGGTYLITGPDWEGQVPEGMTKIWSPTNLAWIAQRTLLKGAADIDNVHAIQDQISLEPLSAMVQGQAPPPPPPPQQQQAAAAALFVPSELQQNPISPRPPFIPLTGIKIYDEIGQAMIGNPLNPPEPALVKKLASIGIGPGMTPSTQANDTIKQALQTGITEGEKLIAAQLANLGEVINGWRIISTEMFGTDYLFRAAVTKLGFGANTAHEAFYPPAYTDSQGRPLNGSNNYIIHFDPGQTPPVEAFWSITMYNNKSLFVDNPINRYNIGQYSEGLKNNTDGSLDIYIQNASPGADKESNWLPSPAKEPFKVIMRMYLPQPQVLNGTYQYPTIQPTAAG